MPGPLAGGRLGTMPGMSAPCGGATDPTQGPQLEEEEEREREWERERGQPR
jgi:hypothetical protein